MSTATGGSENYLLGWGGELELRDGETVIASGERLTGFGEKVAPAPAAATPRTRISKTTSASASSSTSNQALSDKLFRN
jgi:hypothetical protein